MKDMKDLQAASEFLKAYRETQGYKDNLKLMVFDRNWCEFLEKRIKETHGNLSKGEMLFWAAFFTDPDQSYPYTSLKLWFDYIKENGTNGQKLYVEKSIALISQMEKEKQKDSKKDFSNVLNTHKSIFNKAVENGMAEITKDGYKWIYNNGTKASLSYFLHKVFNPKGTGRLPFQALEKLWNVTRLDSALAQVLSAKKPQKWRNQIDNLFINI
mgnify:CR=1 FL=1